MKIHNKKILIISIIVVLFIIVLSLFLIFNKKDKNLTPEETITQNLNSVTTITKTEDLDFATLTSKNDDESTLLISSQPSKDQIIINIRESSLVKENGQSSDYNKTLSSGLNSAIVISTKATAKFYNSKISTKENYEPALFVGGLNSTSIITDTTINTAKDYSPGIIVGENGHSESENIILITNGKASPALLTSHANSKIVIQSSNLETLNSSSPIIDSIGEISFTNTTGTTYDSNFANINSGTTDINSSTIIAAGYDSDFIPNCFHLKGNSTLNITQSSLNINSKLPYYNTSTMFLITNNTSTINLSKTELNIGSNQIINIENSNLTFNLDNQVINGNIKLDNSSTLTINISNNSSFTGKINNSKNQNIEITLDDTSKLTLTENTYIKSLKNTNKTNSNINFNGYKLYINNQPLN